MDSQALPAKQAAALALVAAQGRHGEIIDLRIARALERRGLVRIAVSWAPPVKVGGPQKSRKVTIATDRGLAVAPAMGTGEALRILGRR